MKTPALVMVASAFVIVGCATDYVTRAPVTFDTHHVAPGECLSGIAGRFYDNPKVGYIYLREVNSDRLEGRADVAPGSDIVIPSKQEFVKWMQENESQLNKVPASMPPQVREME